MTVSNQEVKLTWVLGKTYQGDALFLHICLCKIITALGIPTVVHTSLRPLHLHILHDQCLVLNSPGTIGKVWGHNWGNLASSFLFFPTFSSFLSTSLPPSFSAPCPISSPSWLNPGPKPRPQDILVRSVLSYVFSYFLAYPIWREKYGPKVFYFCYPFKSPKKLMFSSPSPQI